MSKLGLAAALAGALVALGMAGQGSEAAQGGGTVSGSVKFTGAKPTMRRIDMSEEEGCASKYTTPPTEESALVSGTGGLANAFVYVKSGLPAGYTAPPVTTPVLLDQDGCRYKPHVFGIRVGQELQIKNSDPLAHNIKSKGKANRPFNISQPNVTRTPTVRTFTAAEVMVPIECNVHGWMQAYAGVLPHGFFAVSGADGKFTIPRLPPGTYTLEAWHEKYGTQTATVTITGAETKTADFTFAGK